MDFTEDNHYVPQWYQKRFIVPGAKDQALHYLDLKAVPRRLPNGNVLYPRALRKGSKVCFVEKNLYTLRFGAEISDVVERQFFGEVDRVGAPAAAFVADYSLKSGWKDEINEFMLYMDAQKLRTPKGLDYISPT